MSDSASLDPRKDPDDRVTGTEPMTGIQGSYRETLSRADGDSSQLGRPATQEMDKLSTAATQTPLEQMDPSTARAALPDDRYDGTDSGPGGTDLPYPPGPEAAEPEPEQPRSPRKPSPVETGGGPSPAAPESASGTDYATDGPDELTDEPQR